MNRHLAFFAAIATVGVAVAALRHAPEPSAPKPRPSRVKTAAAEATPPATSSAPRAEAALEPAAVAGPQLRSRNRAEQSRGLKSLESVSDPALKLSLLRAAMEGLDPSLKSRALLLLKGLSGPEAAAVAIGVLQGSGPSWLRAQAAHALGEIGDPGSVAPLLDASRSDDLDLRAGAATSLDRFGHPGPLQTLISDLGALTAHADGGKRADAVLMLSTLQTPAVIPALTRALVDPTNSRIREAAADALAGTKRPEVVPYLEAALQDPEPRVREAARQGLDKIRR